MAADTSFQYKAILYCLAKARSVFSQCRIRSPFKHQQQQHKEKRKMKKCSGVCLDERYSFFFFLVYLKGLLFSGYQWINHGHSREGQPPFTKKIPMSLKPHSLLYQYEPLGRLRFPVFQRTKKTLKTAMAASISKPYETEQTPQMELLSPYLTDPSELPRQVTVFFSSIEIYVSSSAEDKIFIASTTTNPVESHKWDRGKVVCTQTLPLP